jgi:toxin ParE1/3/4
MKVRWLRKALGNLDHQEANHIAEDDPAATRLVVQRIDHAVKQLADNPALGHPGRVAGTRELVIPNTRYIIPYRVFGYPN